MTSRVLGFVRLASNEATASPRDMFSLPNLDDSSFIQDIQMHQSSTQ